MNEEVSSPFRSRGFIGVFIRDILQLSRRLRLRMWLRSKIAYGKQFTVGKGFDFDCPDFCILGERVSIGKNFTLQCNIDTGNDILISSNVSIIGNDHCFRDPNRTVYTEGRIDPPKVTLKGDNLIGFGVIIVGPVTIGKGCIVGAGAVVTKDLPEYCVCVGIPAKPFEERYNKSHCDKKHNELSY
ncbi:MAG: acyltransferase [Candidatus Electrothrix sp. AR5]|nr:acyltransferase [Candidatus Electrothrix sp. AR5]